MIRVVTVYVRGTDTEVIIAADHIVSVTRHTGYVRIHTTGTRPPIDVSATPQVSLHGGRDTVDDLHTAIIDTWLGKA